MPTPRQTHTAGDDPVKGGRKLLRDAIIVFLAFFVLASAFSGFLAFRHEGLILKSSAHPIDLASDLFYHWYFREAAAGRGSFSRCDLFYHPVGEPIVMKSANFVNALLAQPFLAFFGYPWYFNHYVAFILALNGLGAWLLLRRITGDRLVAFACALSFASSPYFLIALPGGRSNSGALFLLPLYLLSLQKIREDQGRAPIICALLAGLLLVLTWWFNAISLAVFTALFIAVTLLTRDGGPRFGKRMAILTLGGMALALAILPPLFLAAGRTGELSSQMRTSPLPTMAQLEAHRKGGKETPLPAQITNILRDSPDWDYPFEPSRKLFSNGFSCLIVFAAAIGFAISPMRFRLLWGSAALVFYLLSLGPFIMDKGEPVAPEPLYHLLYNAVPFFSRFQWPGKLVPVLHLCLLPFMGAALVYLRARLPKLFYLLVFTCITVLPLVDSLCQEVLPLRGYPFGASPFYERLAAQPRGAVINLPLTESPYAIAYIPLHRQPILGSESERAHWLWPPALSELYRKSSFLRFLHSLERYSLVGSRSFDGKDIDGLYALGYRYVVFYPGYLASEHFRGTPGVTPLHHARRYSECLRSALGPPVYRDSELEAYAITPGGREKARAPGLRERRASSAPRTPAPRGAPARQGESP